MTLAALFGKKPAVGKSADLTRILALPRRARVEPETPTAEALINHVTAKFGRGERQCRCAQIQRDRKVRPKPCIRRPNYVQAWTLHEAAIAGGVVGNICVGGGKTFIDIMAVLALPGARSAVLLIPSTLVYQLYTEYLLVAEHFTVPSLVIHAGPDTKDGGVNEPRLVTGAPTLHVLPYSHFQRAKSTTFLEGMKPDALIVDECQNLASMDSTRSSRFLRYFAEHGSTTRLCAWSGTLTDDEIQDYGHFLALALREGSPLPLVPTVLDEWGEALNPDEFPSPAGALRALCSGPDEHVQDGYHRRLSETLGVVTTVGASIAADLDIQERKPPPIPDNMKADPRSPGVQCPELGISVPKGWWPGVASCLRYLRSTWRRPDGEELVDALSVNRCARELACGLFLRWKFVHGETLGQITEWLAARAEWNIEKREKLKQRLPHLDSEMLLANAAMRAWGHAKPGQVIDLDANGDPIVAPDGDEDLPRWKAESWPRWYAIKDKVKPVTEVVRLDPFLAQDAANWGLQNKGIIWYRTVGFGAWVSELSGLTMHGGGPMAAEKIAAETGERSIVCSIDSHGTGRDGLQRLFSTQLVTQPPSSAVAFEQLFGRLSRIGQDADVVHALIYRHSPEIRACVDAALRKAAYVQRTTGAPQRLRPGWQLGILQPPPA